MRGPMFPACQQIINLKGQGGEFEPGGCCLVIHPTKRRSSKSVELTHAAPMRSDRPLVQRQESTTGQSTCAYDFPETTPLLMAGVAEDIAPPFTYSGRNLTRAWSSASA